MSQQSYTAVDVMNLARDLREDMWQGRGPQQPVEAGPDWIKAPIVRNEVPRRHPMDCPWVNDKGIPCAHVSGHDSPHRTVFGSQRNSPPPEPSDLLADYIEPAVELLAKAELAIAAQAAKPVCVCSIDRSKCRAHADDR